MIEDDRAVQKALMRLFEAEGFAVEMAGNGAEGLEMFRAAHAVGAGAGPEPAGYAGAGRLPGNQPGGAVVADHYFERAHGSDGQGAAARTWGARLCDQAVQSAGASGPGADGDAALDAGSADGDVQLRRREGGLHEDGTVARWELVQLTSQEFKVLKFMIQNAERVLTREELLNQVWGYRNYPSTRTVDNHILRLRQKLEKDPANPLHFRTVHSAGYKFVP